MNKLEEKAILRMVYDEKAYAIIDDNCERPDFIVKDNNSVQFGVEITEYFNTESAARLVKVPNYTNRILDESIPVDKKYIHKKDKKILKVDTISILNEDGSVKYDAKAIVQENLSRERYLESIVNIIDTKNEKGKFYNSNISHIDLLIFDRSGSVGLDDLEYFYEAFYSPNIIFSLKNTIFNEISIIISHKYDKYFFRLKEYLLLSRIYLFLFFYEERKMEIENEPSILQFIVDLLYCLNIEGFREVGVNFSVNKLELFYAGSSIEIIQDGSVQLTVNRYDFIKLPIHSNIPDFLQNVKVIPEDSLYLAYMDYLKANAFRCNCAILCYK